MHRVARLVGCVVGPIVMLWVGLSWGQVPNPTMSDAQGNTAGGTGALMPPAPWCQPGWEASLAGGVTSGSHLAAIGPLAEDFRHQGVEPGQRRAHVRIDLDLLAIEGALLLDQR